MWLGFFLDVGFQLWFRSCRFWFCIMKSERRYTMNIYWFPLLLCVALTITFAACRTQPDPFVQYLQKRSAQVARMPPGPERDAAARRLMAEIYRERQTRALEHRPPPSPIPL